MVDTQIRARGIHDQRLIEAMLKLPRERFLPEARYQEAYDDRALPVGCGQTISQPFIVAFMTEQLATTPKTRVLEIGTGTGYQTALLAMLCSRVFSVERIDALRVRAATVLASMNLSNISLNGGDGSLGLPKSAPFDRILVTAAAPSIPGPLVDQLADGGILILPVGGDPEQTIVRAVKSGRRTFESRLLPCRFVKLIGREAWPGPS